MERIPPIPGFSQSWAQLRRWQFLCLGLTRTYRPRSEDRKTRGSQLLESDGARICRRNIIALSGVLVVAGLAGVDPRDLSVFGLKPNDRWGVAVICIAAMLVQIYWYFLRYFHLREDAMIEDEPFRSDPPLKHLPIRLNSAFVLRQKSANLASNWICFILALLSTHFLISWTVDALL